MPMSSFEHLPVVMHYLSAIKPTKVLDIGIGMGTYGFMARQHFDIGSERLLKSEWKIQIDGVEIFENYRNPIWDYVYNRVLICDIRDIIDSLDRYDVVMCNDVLEHFTKVEAKTLCGKLLEICDVLIVTTPTENFPQGAWGGNTAEEHHCLLKAEDFPNLIAKTCAGVTTCYVCSKEQSTYNTLKFAQSNCPNCQPRKLPYFFARLLKKLHNAF